MHTPGFSSASSDVLNRAKLSFILVVEIPGMFKEAVVWYFS
jgi:hypothetical protein